jgi:ABC-type transport system substrate-binding protein
MKAVLLLALLCTGILLAAGCTSPVVTPIDTPTLTPTPTPTVVPISTPDLMPRPTDVIPPFQQVSIQVTKNTVSVDPWVSVLFAGGSGQSYVTMITATIIRFDGNTETKSTMYPEIGTNILLSGSTRTDRVIVDVTYTDGYTYTAKDELVPFQSPNS